jgi:hypothetical protein
MEGGVRWRCAKVLAVQTEARANNIGMPAHLLHVIPVGHDAVLNRVLEGQDTTLGLSLVTDVAVLLAHANHHTLVARATNDGGEHGARCVITSKAGFAHAGTVIDH